MSSTWQSFQDCARAAPPEVAIILGSGHSQLTARMQDAEVVGFGDVPGLTPPTVAGHEGRLLLGTWSGKRVLIFAGRLHYYEGHCWDDVVQTVRLAAKLGARILVTTNSVGGIRADLEPGAVMAVKNHLQCAKPRWWGSYFCGQEKLQHADAGNIPLSPIQPSPYSRRILELLKKADAKLAQGLYAQVTGPCYETCAEVRALQRIGVDAVGMSTACEIQAGKDVGMECAALSCITNKAAGLGDGILHHGEVLAIAAQQRQKLADLLERFLEVLDSAD